MSHNHHIQNIKLKGAPNIRDLGGTPVKGGIVKPNMFLRGGHLNSLTIREGAYLQDLCHIKTIIDLRTDKECDERPDLKLPGARRYHYPVFDETAVGITHEEGAQQKPKMFVPDLTRKYAEMIDDPCCTNLAHIMRHIVEMQPNEFPVLFHCTEGKDRTGVIAMLILTMLGASREDIFEDYMFTNTVNKSKAEKFYWQIRIFKRNLEAAARVRDIYLAKKEYLNAAYDAAAQKYGSMQGFITNGLRISPAQQKRFIEMSVEK